MSDLDPAAIGNALGVQFLAQLVVQNQDSFALVNAILSPADSNVMEVTHYIDQIKLLAAQHVSDVCNPVLNGSLPEQRLLVTFFGFEEAKRVDKLIANEIITRVKGFIGHLEETVKKCKLEFAPTEHGFTVKNFGDASNGTYCFAEVQIKLGAMFVITLVSMGKHLIDHSLTEEKKVVVKVPGMDGIDPDLEFRCSTKLSSRGLKYFVAPIADFPTNDNLNKAVTLITSIFEPSMDKLTQIQKETRAAKLKPCVCVLRAAGAHAKPNPNSYHAKSNRKDFDCTP